MSNIIVKFILVYWTWAALAAQFLSYAKRLNTEWMLVAHIPLAAVLWYVFKDEQWHRLFRKKRFVMPRGFALLFAALAALLLVGSIMSLVPKQADYLEYRLARVMVWIMNGEIGYLDGWERRLNYSGTGQECAVLPSILLFRTDFSAQMFSFLMFCTLPGLTFRVLRGLGAKAANAVKLMWILPVCVGTVITQGAGSGNDFPCLWFATLATALTLELNKKFGNWEIGKLGKTNRTINFPTSQFPNFPIPQFPLLPLVCAAAVLTNIKSVNAFLLFPLAFIVLRLLLTGKIKLRVVETLACAALFIFASIVPTLNRNYQNTGNFSGKFESNRYGIMTEQTVANFAVSALSLPICALQTPVFPGVETFKSKIDGADVFAKRVGSKTINNGPAIRLGLMQTEEMTGVAINWTAGLLAALLFRLRSGGRHRGSNRAALRFAGSVTLFAVLAVWQMSVEGFLGDCIDRIMVAYWYIILLALWVWAMERELPASHRRLANRIPTTLGFFAYACAFATALLVPTRMIIPDSWFVKASSLVSESMGKRAEDTAFAYRHHGREYMGLTPPGFEGRLAFISNNLHPAYGAYWRTGDSLRFNDWRKITPVWYNDASILTNNAIIIASPVLPLLGYDDIDTLAAENGLEIAAHKQAIMKIKAGRQDVWFLRRK